MMRRAHHVVAEDPALVEAGAEARRTFGYFWREATWENRRTVPALDSAAVKLPFVREVGGEPVTEHMWVDAIDFDGTTVRGRLVNQPLQLDLVAGAAVSAPFVDVEDWMFVVDRVLHGGFSIQAIRRGMGPWARRRHDRAWGLRFPHPTEVLLVHGQHEHPERLREHPMCLAAADGIDGFVDALLAKDPAALVDQDDAGLTVLHVEALAGNALVVAAMLRRGADLAVCTRAGETALDLARRFGWDHVVAVLTD